jgi:hypothetical protein
MLLVAYFNSLGGAKEIISVHKSTLEKEKINYGLLITMLLSIAGYILVTIHGIEISFRLL